MEREKIETGKRAWEAFGNIEEEFFETDKEKSLATIRLSFDKVSDVFDLNYISKQPVLSDDFMDWIESTFRILPSRYKIKLVVSFGDYEGYDEARLNDIFWKNILLDFKSRRDNQKKRNFLAYGLIAAGLVFFAGMLAIEFAWKDDSVLRTVFSYISDIATTVTFWEAMNILIVERREQRSYLKAIRKRFIGVEFAQNGDGAKEKTA